MPPRATPPIGPRPNAVPTRPVRRAGAFARVAALIVAGAVAASPGHAIEVVLDPPHESSGYVWVHLRLSDVFPPRVEESLARGMPATLHMHAELWRRRVGWFDRLESSFDASMRIRLEQWSRTYHVERRGADAVALASLDSVRAFLSAPLGLPVGRVGLLEPDVRYYVVLTATLKPLSVEDVMEGEGWLSGESEPRRSRLGVLTALPRSLFDAVRNFAGFGDQRGRAISPFFGLETLFPTSR